MVGGAGCAITGAGGGGATGFVTGGKTTAGFSGGAAASFFCVIAFSTSPGREMCDRSILVLISSSPRSPRELDLPAGRRTFRRGADVHPYFLRFVLFQRTGVRLLLSHSDQRKRVEYGFALHFQLSG
jgi:hypothetical protein